MEINLRLPTAVILPYRWRLQLHRLSLNLLNFFVFGAYPANRWLLRLVQPQRARLARAFDPAFYLAQFPTASGRARAARDPLLNYWLIGRRMGRWPNPGFDPDAYRQAKPYLPLQTNLFSHYLRELDSGRESLRAPSPSLAEGSGPVVLLLDHGRGGGSSRMLGIYKERLAREGWRVLAPLRVGKATPLFVFADHAGWRVFNILSEEAAFTSYVMAQGVRRMVVNHLVDLPEGAADWVASFAKKLGAPYEVLLHDYYLACPRIDLIASDGFYCGLASVERCQVCLAASSPQLALVDPAVWRGQSQSFLAGAARVIAPSRDLADRLNSAFPAAAIEVWEPEAEADVVRESNPPALAEDEPLRVVLIGALNWPKGLDVVTRLALTVQRRAAPIAITLIGPTEDPFPLRRAGVCVLGQYVESDLGGLIEAAQPHVIFSTAIWPETWSFTLTAALRTKAEIVAFDLGAIAMRLKRLGRGRLLPLALHTDSEALADALLAIRAELMESTPPKGPDLAL